MATTSYRVRAGDTLSDIARRNGYRYWANIFLDNANRSHWPGWNPNLIHPRDQFVLPDKSSISVIERRGAIRQPITRLVAQNNENSCWHAALKMLFLKKHTSSNPEAFDRRVEGFYSRRGGQIAISERLLTGLPVGELVPLASYCGLSAGTFSSYHDLHRYLQRGVLSLARIGTRISHLMVLSGYDLDGFRWRVVDPWSMPSRGPAVLEFGGMEISVNPRTGASTTRSSSTAVWTDFVPGPTTVTNMARWIQILPSNAFSNQFVGTVRFH